MTLEITAETPSTQTNDRGGMDARHYIRIVLEIALAPWWKTLPDKGRDYELVEDGNPAHRAGESTGRRAELGIKTVCPHQFVLNQLSASRCLFPRVHPT
jgi:hypothetical protein